MRIIKTKRSLYNKAEKEILENHNYSLPQITVIEISGSKEYLGWIEKEAS